MSANVSLLLLLVTIDPYLPSIFFSRYLLILLRNFIVQLFSLNVVLLFKSLFLNFKLICSPLTLNQLPLLVLKFCPVLEHQ